MTANEHIEEANNFYGKNEIKANIHLRQASSQGSADAFFELALRYAKGIPVLDPEEAKSCLIQADLLGSLKAEYAIESYQRSIIPEIQEPDALLRAIEKSKDLNKYDLESHERVMVRRFLNTGEYDEYYMQTQKTLAELGCSYAAEELASAYSENWFDHETANQREAMRWTLIGIFLCGDQNWTESVNNDLLIDKNDRAAIVEEIHTWINDHPIAKKASLSSCYKSHFIKSRGPVDLKLFSDQNSKPFGGSMSYYCTRSSNP